MKRIKRWLTTVYNRRTKREYDAVVSVIGGEGVGKSTLMLQLVGQWQEIRGHNPDVDSVLDSIVWAERAAFKEAMVNRDPRSAITVHDAARVLHKREAMHGEQVEIEKDLLDVRTKGFLMLFGYQGWKVMPDLLQSRRANFALYVPYRGTVYGYSREKLNEWYKSGDRPEPVFKDTFPALDGTELWAEFRRRDREAKDERISEDEPQSPEDAARREQIKIALRAVKPWDEPEGMSQREAAKLTDYSRGWVSDRVQEWRDGKHRDLVDSPPKKTA